MRELGMLITSSSRERLKVVWGEGPRLYRAYEIDRAPVSGIAEEIRRCLGDLKACWRPSGGDYASALHELASKGAVLYDLLFPADASDDHPSKLAEEFLLYGKRARDGREKESRS